MRRACEALAAQGAVSLHGTVVDDPRADIAIADGDPYAVDGRPWVFWRQALVVLHKPAGYECSQKPKHHPSVLSLLPAPLRQRGVQPVGRLDEDTTGLLLLTDDGPLIHRLTSPKHHVAKRYEVTCRHPLDAAQVQRLLDGVVLNDAKGDTPEPVRALAAEATGPRTLRMTLTEGRYHQVKRMLAAVGNRVDGLHRSAMGALVLGDDPAPGRWRWATVQERTALGLGAAGQPR